MRFAYAPDIQSAFPMRKTAVLQVSGIHDQVDVADATQPLIEQARARLAAAPEGEWPEIRAWRAAFSQMGLKPTKVRCAAEALLRRLRKDGSLPAIHPLIDLCNAASAAHAIPVAVFDRDRVAGDLLVRHAEGTESYDSFSGAVETPEQGEVIFADDDGHAHARRWCNRQSRRSAVTPATRQALIVAEAVHDTAADDLAALAAVLSTNVNAIWQALVNTAQLHSPDAQFDDGTI